MTAPTGRAKGRTPSLALPSMTDYSDVKAPLPPKNYPLDIKKEWIRIWKIGTWLHREQHLPLVKQYCDTLLMIQESKDSLDEYYQIDGETTTQSYRMSNGSWASYPEVRLIKELYALITSLLIELRLTPATSPVDTTAMKEKLATLTTQNRGV